MLHAGAPRDEYEGIVDKLFMLLSQETSEAEVATFLEREVHEHFHTTAPQAAQFAAKVLTWSRMRSQEAE